MRSSLAAAACVTALLTFTSIVGAQDRPQAPAQPRSERAPVPPPQQLDCPIEVAPRVGPDTETRGQGDRNLDRTLSDKLSQSEGIICPPRGVDPGIAATPPGGGLTPVIPPPGSPGGDPTVRPK
jgi:hypothetical protein